MKEFLLMTGAIFEDDPIAYPEKLDKLNKQYQGIAKVNEVYGSLLSSYSYGALPTARPDHRLKDIDITYLKDYVQACNDRGIIFNYTANAPLMGDLQSIDGKIRNTISFLKTLERIGVGRITVANPILMNIVCTYTKLPIEVSTIQNVRQPAEIIRLKQLYPNINKVCLSIDINRNMNDLVVMKSVCDELNVECEVIATEFCKTERSNCVHRMHCYNLHSYNMTKACARQGKNSDGSKQNKVVAGYPWNGSDGCIFSRTKDNVPWLISNTVWPQVIDQYQNVTGINQLKITTRTAPPEYGLWLTEAFMKKSFDGRLSKLWLQLQASDKHASCEAFEKAQENGVNNVPYDINDLLEHRHLSFGIEGQTEENKFNFFDLFFAYPHIDWSKIVWVDKPSSELKLYECNWADIWNKLLTK